MKKLLAGLFLLGSVLAFAAGEKRVPIEKMELNQQTSMVYVQGEQTPFTGTVEKKYASGKLEATMEFKNGKLDGKTLVYNETGKMISEESYANGALNGVSKSFYANGSVEFETTFKNNVKEGVEKHYSPSGRVETEVLFKNNAANGIAKQYNAEGKL